VPRGQPRGPRQRPGAQAAEARAPLLAGAAALAASECRKVLRRLRVVTDKREKRREGLPFARMLAKIAHANALAVFDAIVGLARPGPIPFFFFHLQVKNKYCHVSGSKAGGGGGCACMRASVRRPISAAFSPMRALEMTASTCTSRCGGGSGGVSQQGGAVHAGCQT